MSKSMSNRITTIVVVICFAAVTLLTVSMIFGLRGPQGGKGGGAGADVAAGTGVLEYAEGIRGYLAMPEGDGPHAGIVLVHDWSGLDDGTRSTADTLAEEGYVVLAVDLFGGKTATTPAEGTAMVAALDQAKALQNLKAAAASLRSRGATKMAALGRGFGGGQALRLAMSGVPLDAMVISSATPLVTDEKQLQGVTSPVLGIFGDQDADIPVARIDEFGKTLARLEISNEFHIYPGVGHDFTDPSSADYAPNETKDAWGKTLVFLASHLR